MTIATNIRELAGHRLVGVSLGAGLEGDAPGKARDLIERAVAALASAGLGEDRLVRSRIWARDATLRRTVSDARIAVLKGERRAASSSFIAPARLAPGIDAVIDLEAMEGFGPRQLQEYEPAIAPPRFLRREDLVFLSGITDTQGPFEAQLETVVGLIGGSLTAACTAWGSIVQVSAFVHDSVPWRQAHEAIRARFPCPVELTLVEGYSAPEKRLEIEVTVRG